MAGEPVQSNPKKKGGKFKFMVLMILSCLALPFMFGSVLLIFVGMIPTFLAYFADDDPDKQLAASMGAMNFAGIVPSLIDLWGKGQAPSNAIQMLSEAHTWIMILGASLVGGLIVYVVPQAIASISQSQADARIKTLKKNLDLLKDAWGSEVATTKPVDKIGQE